MIFNRVKNPPYVKDTSNFRIILAADQNLSLLIADEQHNIPASLLSAGSIAPLMVSPLEKSVQAQTFYQLNFAPQTDISSRIESKITIKLPPEIANTSQCTIQSKSSQFSSSMGCRSDPSTRTYELSYVFSNKPDFRGGTTLQLVIGPIVNPISSQYLNPIQISSYIRQGSFYLVDQGESKANTVLIEPGYIAKLAEVRASNLQTLSRDAMYTFEMQF